MPSVAYHQKTEPAKLFHRKKCPKCGKYTTCRSGNHSSCLQLKTGDYVVFRSSQAMEHYFGHAVFRCSGPSDHTRTPSSVMARIFPAPTEGALFKLKVSKIRRATDEEISRAVVLRISENSPITYATKDVIKAIKVKRGKINEKKIKEAVLATW